MAQHLRREQQLVFEHWVDEGSKTLHFKPLGVLWFGSVSSFEAKFTALLTENPDLREVCLHFGGLGRIDLSAAMILKQLMDDARQAGLEIKLCDVPPMAKSLVERVWRD